jgi:hypothetical protein
LIIKVSISGQLGSSKPCVKCVNYMMIRAREKGYKINKIYYSTTENTIVCQKLADLYNETNKHVSKGRYKSAI